MYGPWLIDRMYPCLGKYQTLFIAGLMKGQKSTIFCQDVVLIHVFLMIGLVTLLPRNDRAQVSSETKRETIDGGVRVSGELATESLIDENNRHNMAVKTRIEATYLMPKALESSFCYPVARVHIIRSYTLIVVHSLSIDALKQISTANPH